MAESQDHADGEKVDPIKAGANNASGSETPPVAEDSADAATGSELHKNLPMVLSPKLGADEDEPVEETAQKPAEETVAAAAAPANSTRFLMLAATVAFTAAFGSFVGSVTGSGFAHIYYPAASSSSSSQVSADTTTLQQMNAELAALKAEVDSTMRGTNGQYSKIADRLDRLDQHFASADTTGSIAASTAPSPDQPKINDRILQDWVVQGVQNGRALVESRYGGMFDVGAGSVLPGVGRVDSIKRQDGQWLVLTARGTITSGR
ncbi:MAG TPA: hypothetical protein VE396_07025 [Xanthobacteraceae bacterium]|nr:hypothetical protein [Xanthobacteraceae bacterium]